MFYSEQIIDLQLFDNNAFSEALFQTKQPISLFREALLKGREVLHARFEANKSADEVVYQRAWLIDQILRQTWLLFDLQTPLALIAVGGYGRGELHPSSDVDILILSQHDLNEQTQNELQKFITFLWDINLEVGSSVRSITECVEIAEKDITVITNLIESRLLIGEKKLFEELQILTSPDKIWKDRVFFEAKMNEQRQRHLRFNDTAYNLEPNIKEGPSGLRDLQTIIWVTKRHFGAGVLYDLVKHNFLTEDEYKTLLECQSFIWKIRYILHKITNRHEDRLLFDYQREVARILGFKEDDERMDVENFMQQYYRTAREITVLNEMLLQHFQEEILHDGPTEIKPLNSRFQICNEFIEVVHDKIFERYPFALLEIFLLWQYHPEIKGIRASTGRLIRRYNKLIDQAFLRDIRTRSLFIEIIRQPIGVTHAFRAMNRYGVLSAYIPSFGKIIGQMQYDLFHVYTVDQHTLFIIRNLRRLAILKHDHELPRCSEIMKNLHKPELLYLAGLFHDIAKGRKGDHSELGAKDAFDFCLAHGLSGTDSRFVSWLVQNHLVMSTTAQRKDIADPDIINAFAQRVEDIKHLDYLYLLTVADIRATSPKLWNDWKASLLYNLYSSTKQALQRGLQNPINRSVRIQDLKNRALELLIPEDHIKAKELWNAIDDDYFLRATAANVAHETQAMLHKPSDSPLVLIRHSKEGSVTEFLIYTEDKESLFVDTTYCLELQQVNIVDAYIITTANRFTLVNYTILEEDNQPIADYDRAEGIRKALEFAVQETQPIKPINRIWARVLKCFPVPTRVTFNIDNKNNQTIMEVITTDRPGVLSRIAQALVNAEAKLKNAKIATFGNRVEDTFVITDKNNQAIRSPEQLDYLQEQLSQLLDNTAR
jgi:[protein-PII] uridylyltransferase